MHSVKDVVKCRRQRGHEAYLGKDDLDNRISPTSSEGPIRRGCPILGATEATA
jgi:hypothetical protein